MPKHLPQVTMVCIDTHYHAKSMAAIRRSLTQIQPHKTLFLTDVYVSLPGVETVKIEPLNSKEAYSHFIVKELVKYLETDFVLIIQHDGYVLDSRCWTDEFLKYDYIGAPWPYNDNNSVGNGGFSLRSKKLMHWLTIDPHIKITHPEDEIICRLYGKYLQLTGFTFAPIELAVLFSFEQTPPLQPTFGFHQYYHKPYRPVCVIKRMAAAGDVIMAEPLMERMHNDGYQVVLQTRRDFWEPFMFHKDLYYPVWFYDDLVKEIGEVLFNAPGYRFIDLDMAYENNPQQPVLKCYYESAGIKDGDMRNSRLSNYCRPENKLFKKYVVVHIDDTDMPWRNIGVSQKDWKDVWAFLTFKGYMVLQIGRGTAKTMGTRINTNQDNFLNFLLGGCDFFIGQDSMPLQLAVALGVKSIGFFGSVDSRLRYSDFSRLIVMQSECPKQNCYHGIVGTRGQECLMGDEIPRCTRHTGKEIIEAIKEFL